MISKKHKTIFVHIPKAGGQSIETMFLANEGLQWENRSALLLRKKKDSEEGPERLAHLKASEYVDLGYISRQEFSSYFKFAFVRNPYKRVFSFYNFLGYSKIMTLQTFVEKVLPNKINSSDFFFFSQYDYLYNSKGDLLVGFVGKLESIQQDIQQVISKSGLKNAALPHVNKSKGEWNRVLSLLLKNPKFWSTYKRVTPSENTFEKQFTKGIKEQVYQIYQKDFQYFNYDK